MILRRACDIIYSVKLFDIILSNDIQGAEELFLKGASAGEDGTVSLNDGQIADFDAYFNLLSYGTYSKYCGAERFAVEIAAEGAYLAEIYVRRKSGKTVRAAYAECENSARLEADLSRAGDGGYAFLRLTARGDCIIYGGNWSADIPERRRVKVGIIICTYKREKFVCANLERMRAAIEARPERAERLHVFIVDNAKTLQLEQGGFYTVIPNGNSGGSGGFTRGICEVCADPSYTHFLLMDDDIRFDFAVVERTCNLLSALTDEHAYATVGGAMLVMEKPCMQYEYGGKYNGLNFKLINSGLDMRDSTSLLRNENHATPDYNAWWYCCMPASTPKKYGLPMPFFIKGDDVEYGMRAAEEIIISSGIAVWHQDFAGKYTGILEYYIKRNMAIVSALRGRGGGFKAAVRFAYFIFKNLILKNYDCAEVLYLAYLDFKRGPEFFLTADPEKVNDEIRAYAQPFLPPEDIEAIFGGRPEPKVRSTDKKKEFFHCLFFALEIYLPAFMLRNRFAITDAGYPCAADCFMKKTVVQIDRATGRGLVLEFDGARRRKLRRAAYRAFFGLLFCYGRIKKKYIAQFEKMTSYESWCEIFNGERPHGRQ